eukprot:c24912_g1_i2 orf=197-1288(-)
MSTSCPFVRLSPADAERPDKEKEKPETVIEQDDEISQQGDLKNPVEPPTLKCPFGYDSGSLKLGPLSCVICRSLLFESSKCVPCGHTYCRFCISRFNDCPVCGVDIDGIEADSCLQEMVDRFIEGHARIKRPVLHCKESSKEQELQNENVIYEDVSLARGSFLVQQAMRAFQAENLESARARLGLCADDIRAELERSGPNSEICLQLGAVLGMLGDCSRSMGDSEMAARHYEESVELLSGLPSKDAEVIHALSVSLNKLGDLKYYADDLQSAHRFYARALDVRKKALNDCTQLSSQVLDVAVSLAKVADVDRALGNDIAASEGFREAVKTLEGLSLVIDKEATLERRRLSILDFLHSQLRTVA